jgi:phosphoribosylglycinamide formyltransferase-1
MNKAPSHIAIFASGAGSNALQIIRHFAHSDKARISLIVCNKPGAGILQIADKEHIPTLILEKEAFFQGDAYVPELKAKNIDLIILAGFLWKIPPALIRAYPDRIVNIHPALLPKYGGKGMYGRHVHQAVIDHKEKESGISIHFVDEYYDHGSVIFQARCPVLTDDTPETLAKRVQTLEHAHFPKVIEGLL